MATRMNRNKRLRKHLGSFAIAGVVLLMLVFVFVASLSLRVSNANKQERIAELESQIEAEEKRICLTDFTTVSSENENLYNEIHEKLSWEYPKEWLTKLQGKMTVSELKKMEGESMTGEVLYPKIRTESSEETDATVLLAQQKGTATHKIFELLPFCEMKTQEDVEHFIQRLVDEERIPKLWQELIPSENIYAFCLDKITLVC